MRKLWLGIVSFFHGLAWGMKSADKIVTNSNKDIEGGNENAIIQQKETHSVYDDLLRGEVTQEVKEFRHEMYYAERKSHEYEYKGNGTAAKKNEIFDYDGNVDNSDNRKILIVQINKEDPSTLYDFGIYPQLQGDTLFKVDEKKMDDPSKKSYRDFTIQIERDFTPTMRLEEWANKIVVKQGEGKGARVLDIYVSVYPKEFDRRSRIFHNELERIYMGDKRSDVIDFKRLGFITAGAYGADDLIVEIFKNIRFFDIHKYDGNYVLKFYAIVDQGSGHDIVEEFYDESAAKKSENHEMREGATVSLENVLEIEEREKGCEEGEKLMEEFENEQNL